MNLLKGQNKIFLAAFFGIILILCIGLFNFCCGKKTAVDKSKPLVPPADIILTYIRGPSDGASALIVKLFSQITRQKAINSVAEKIVPVELSISRKTWEKGLSFFVIGENGKKVKIGEGIRLRKAPDETKFILGPDNVYSVLYEVSRDPLLKQGAKVMAELKIDRYVIESNTVIIPPPITDKYTNLLSQARVQRQFGEFEKLLVTAGEMISENPRNVSGYWYKGVALEEKGDYKNALIAFETALENVPIPQKGEHKEPPILLIRRIKALREKLK